MNIQWFSNSLKGLVTIYETNITLNTVASGFFTNFYSTIIGFDASDNTLVIKGVSKSDVEEGSYKDVDLHPISIKPSYGRITGKKIITNLCNFYPIDFNAKKMHKYHCEWIESKNYLKIYLDKEVK